jgi:hypothetical protein
MRLLLFLLGVLTTLTTATLTWRLQRAQNPTTDQSDAYWRIESAMNAAVARYNRLTSRPSKSLTVQYVPSVPTADGNFNGNIRFGANRAYMNERTALHEISHTLGLARRRLSTSGVVRITGRGPRRCCGVGMGGVPRLIVAGGIFGRMGSIMIMR